MNNERLFRSGDQENGFRESRPCVKCSAVVLHRQMKAHGSSGLIRVYFVAYKHSRPDGSPCEAQGRTT